MKTLGSFPIEYFLTLSLKQCGESERDKKETEYEEAFHEESKGEAAEREGVQCLSQL